MKILIIKLSSIGDVIHTLPALRALKKRFPEAEIDWLTEDPSFSLLEYHPDLRKVWIFRKNLFKSSLWGYQEIKELLRLVRGLRERKYNLVIDFQGLLKSGLFAYFSKGERRIGFNKTRELSYLFLNERLPPFDPDVHAVDRYMEIPKALGYTGDVDFSIPILLEDRKRVEALLEVKGVKKRDRLILISPWARWESKLWDKEKFITLCREIKRRYDAKIAIVGGTDAKDYISKAKFPDNGSVIDLTGETNLRELAYLTHLSMTLITPDSGPMHIASAIGKKVVALFGPTSPCRTGPYGEGHRVITKGLSCSPCFLRRCESRDCMNEIDVKDVVKGLDDILLKRSK